MSEPQNETLEDIGGWFESSEEGPEDQILIDERSEEGNEPEEEPDPEPEDDSQPENEGNEPGEAVEPAAETAKTAEETETDNEPGEKAESSDNEEEKADNEAPFVFERPDGEVEELSKDEVAQRLTELYEGREKVEEGEARIQLAQDLIEGIKKKPLGVLYDVLEGTLGDRQKAHQVVLEHAQAIVQAQQTYEQLPEAERIRIETQAQLDARDRELAKLREKLEADEREREQMESYNAAIGKIKPALERAGLQATDTNIRRVLSAVRAAEEQGQVLTPTSVARELKQEVDQAKADLLKEISTEDLVAARPDLEKEINARALDKAKTKRAKSMSAGSQSPKETRKRGPKVETYTAEDYPLSFS